MAYGRVGAVERRVLNPMTSERDTIYALSSGLGRAALAVIRLSGPATRDVTAAVAGRLPPPRRATLAAFKDPGSGEAIDRGLVIYFEAPKSFTGEDCAEFHIHGGLAVVDGLLGILGRFERLRPAEPGEFTRRAFENGKLDLTEAEGLADLIDAQTAAQRRQAFRQMDGSLGMRAEDWRSRIVEATALIAADIDFADEGDVTSLAGNDVARLMLPVLEDLRAQLSMGRAGELLRDGLVVVIAGPPNVGKSTLLNALARRKAAIVSAVPGTTRDAIEVHLDIEGLPLTLIDTAGLRPSADEIEAIGMGLARKKAETADLVLWLSEAAAPSAPDLETKAEVWPIFTKADLFDRQASVVARKDSGLFLSAATGENLDLLIKRLGGFARVATAQGQNALITRERHRLALAAAAAALSAVVEATDAPVEIIAEHLRAACRALESLIGRVDVEDILGEVFARFCIGK
ncbi:MAG: tRNA uridine-5-carboxymethylaminomethyl(34) synthesis GTPase MnmE [Beijerinckiaceae bacterium]